MRKLKEKFGKYFQFKNTIDGMTYFLRGLATILFAIPIGIFMGIGMVVMASNAVIGSLLVLLGCLFIIPMIWFSLATTYKRINSFFPKQATLLTILTFLWSGIGEVFNPNSGAQPGDTFANPANSPMYLVIIIIGFTWSLYLLFGNSKVKKHIG
jgi:hypothetical protein